MPASTDSPATALKELTAAPKTSPLWRFFASVKVGVSCLIVLSLLSIIGTIIPQTTGAADTLQGYIARIGPERTALYEKMGLLDVYHSWWFNLVLVVMCTSITVASIDRWPRIRQQFAADEPIPPASRFRSAPFRRSWDLLAAHAKADQFQELFARFFGRSQVLHVGERETVLYSNRGRWSRMGMFFVHIGILVTAAGSLLGNFWGFTNGQMFIREGTMANRLLVLRGVSPEGQMLTEPRTLPFALRCDDFEVQFYKDPRTGATTRKPSLFRSQLTVLENGRPVMTRDIFVNDPLRYGGYTFYQSSYQEAEQRVRLSVEDTKTGERFPIVARLNEPFGLAGEESRYVARGYEEDFQLAETEQHGGSKALGPALGMEMIDKEGEGVSRFLLFKNFPRFDGERGARHRLTFVDIDQAFYTGLQIAKDPGVWVVWAGCALMVGGMCLAFFLAHRKSWLKLTADGAAFAGTTHKHRLGFEKKVREFFAAVEESFPAATLTRTQAASTAEE